MTKEQAFLLELMAHNITGAKINTDTCGIDWVALIREAISQTVSVVALDSVTPIKEKVPEDIYKKWFNHSYGSMAINTHVEKSQRELIKYLEGKGYDYVILKGLSAASFYEKPELRMLGDVDFLINPDEKESVKELLKGKGYAVSHENHVCHIVFTKPGAHLEMHFDISGMPKDNKAEKLRAFMGDITKNPQRFEYNGGFNAPQNKYHAVILLLHMQHHLLGEGIGLRHLQDWACFVNKTATEGFWEKELIPLLKEVGLLTFMNVITSVCVKYLKISAPVWLKVTDDALCEEIMEDILSGGNFGKKDKLRGRMAMGMAEKGTGGRMKAALKTLKATTPDVCPLVKKYKILYPFVYFYRIVRYLFLLCIGKRIPLNKSIPVAEKRKGIYNKLHIFEVAE